MTKNKNIAERFADLCDDGQWNGRTEREESISARKLLAVFRDTAKRRGFRIEGITLEAMGSRNKY